MSIKNIQQCCSLLEYDGEMFVGIFTNEKKIYYSLNRNAPNSTIWAVLDCRNCPDLLASYLLGNATLLQLYEKAKRHIEQELSAGELERLPQKLDEPPFEESVLFYPAKHAFETTFPNKKCEDVPSFCDRETILKAAVEKHFPHTSPFPEEKPDNTPLLTYYKNKIQQWNDCTSWQVYTHSQPTTKLDTKEYNMAIFIKKSLNSEFYKNFVHHEDDNQKKFIPVLNMYSVNTTLRACHG